MSVIAPGELHAARLPLAVNGNWRRTGPELMPQCAPCSAHALADTAQQKAVGEGREDP
jgi:hypothetical protein